MDRRLANILQTISLAMLAWFAYVWLGKLHHFLVILLFGFTAANAMTTWMLREQWTILETACRIALVRRYVRFVCSHTGEQPPFGPRGRGSASEVLLRSKHDFEIAKDRAKQIVRGHDSVVDGMLTRIHENLTLRKRRRNRSRQGPWASFVLAGGEGVGKRYLVRVLAKLLYREGIVDVFDCGSTTPEQLIGAGGHEGELLKSVRKEPERVILFEHIERSSMELIRVFVGLLTAGKLRTPGADKEVSFRGTIVVFTTTEAAELLSILREQRLSESAWHQRATELLAQHTRVESTLFGLATDVFYCEPPDDLVKSEVVALLLQRECSDHRTKLAFVDPEIIATQVVQLKDKQGFAEAPQMVTKLLRRPLVAAASENHRSLALRVRHESSLT